MKPINVCWHDGVLTENEKIRIVKVFVSGMSQIRSYKPCERLEPEGLRVISIVEDGRARLLKAEVESEIVGFALFTPQINVANEVQQRVSLFVADCDKTETGQRIYSGVGTALRDFVLKEYQHSGVTLVGNVKLENKVARGLYYKWGGKELEPGQTFNNQDPKISIGVKYNFPKP